MKKSTVKTKLVLHTETTRVLRDKDLSGLGAGQGGNNDGTHQAGTCVVYPATPDRP
jgi:hypothetical protein